MSNLAASLREDGPRPKWHAQGVAPLVICFTIAFLLALTRRLHPFYAYGEDGPIFYQQASDLGLRSLLVPDGGYLHVGLRIMALGLALFPPALMPYAMTLTALAIQAAVATFIFSDELSNLVPSRFYRGLLAFVYIGLPDIDEVFGHFVNVQWHLAIVSALLIFARTPAARSGKVARLVLVTILSLTGPFMAFLAPLTAYKLFRSRTRYNLGLLLCALPSMIQMGIVLRSNRPTRAWQDLLRPLQFPRTVGGRGVLSAAVSPHFFQKYFVDAPVLWAATFAALVFVIYAIAERKRFAALMLYLGTWIMFTSIWGGVGSVITRIDPKFSNRYYFIFGFGILATIISMLYSEKPRVRWATAGCVAALLAWSWALPYPDDFWPRYEAALKKYDKAAPGKEVVFPEVPEDWTFQIKKR